MKKAWILTCALLFVAAASFGETASPAPLTSEALAAILALPAASGPCNAQVTAAPEQEVLFAASRPRAGGEKALCTATASCASGTVSCQGNNSTTSCTAKDRNCSIGERGRVICDGVTTLCPTACSQCEICDATGDCVACCRCDGGFGCIRQCNPF